MLNQLDPTMKDFILSDEIHNDGMRIFNSESITIDQENKTITFTAKNDEKFMGVPDFLTRTELTEELIKIYSCYLPNLEYENNVFNFTEKIESKKPIHPETGGALAISNVCLYRDPSGEILIPVPIARPNANYALEAKTSRTKLLGSHKLPNLNSIKNLIDPTSKLQEENNLILLGEKNKKDNFLQKIDELKLGEWNIKVQSEDKKYVTEINNCVVGRGPEGTFEVVEIDAFQSIESVLENFKIKEKIGYDRPVCLIKLSNLMEYSKGSDIDVEDIYYKGKRIKDTSELEDGFLGKFDETGEKIKINNFLATYPFQLFLDNVFNLISSPEIKATLDNYLKKSKAILEPNQFKKYDAFEKLFGERYFIDGFNNTQPIKADKPKHYTIEDIKTKITESKFSTQAKNNMIQYIEDTKDFDSEKLEIDPDYIIPTDNGNILIEYKYSKNAYKKAVKQKARVNLFILLYNDEINKYITIIENGEDTKVNKTTDKKYMTSTLTLRQLGLLTQKTSIDFFKNINSYI